MDFNTVIPFPQEKVVLNERQASEELIAGFQRMLTRYNVTDGLISPGPADIEVAFIIRSPAPVRVTGVYDTYEAFVRDATNYYATARQIDRAATPAPAAHVIAGAATILQYLIQNGCMIYSGRGENHCPEYYVGLTPTTTCCVAVTFRDHPDQG